MRDFRLFPEPDQLRASSLMFHLPSAALAQQLYEPEYIGMF